MKKLSEKEEKMLYRYIRCSITLNSFMLFKTSALASNKLMNILEDTFENRELNPKDYIFLKLLAEKKGKNFKSLSGIDGTINFFVKLRTAAFKGIKLDQTV